MPEYEIRPDDRGWPMAHEIRADGTVAVEPSGSMIGVQYAIAPATIKGVRVDAVRVTLQWFNIGPAAYWAGDWEIEQPPSSPLRIRPDDRDIAIELFGHAARGAWCGENRIHGKTRFPLTFEEWQAVGLKDERR